MDPLQPGNVSEAPQGQPPPDKGGHDQRKSKHHRRRRTTHSAPQTPLDVPMVPSPEDVGLAVPAPDEDMPELFLGAQAKHSGGTHGRRHHTLHHHGYHHYHGRTGSTVHSTSSQYGAGRMSSPLMEHNDQRHSFSAASLHDTSSAPTSAGPSPASAEAPSGFPSGRFPVKAVSSPNSSSVGGGPPRRAVAVPRTAPSSTTAAHPWGWTPHHHTSSGSSGPSAKEAGDRQRRAVPQGTPTNPGGAGTAPVSPNQPHQVSGQGSSGPSGSITATTPTDKGTPVEQWTFSPQEAADLLLQRAARRSPKAGSSSRLSSSRASPTVSGPGALPLLSDPAQLQRVMEAAEQQPLPEAHVQQREGGGLGKYGGGFAADGYLPSRVFYDAPPPAQGPSFPDFAQPDAALHPPHLVPGGAPAHLGAAPLPTAPQSQGNQFLCPVTEEAPSFGDESSFYSLATSADRSPIPTPDPDPMAATATMERAFTSTEAQMALYRQELNDARMREALRALGVAVSSTSISSQLYSAGEQASGLPSTPAAAAPPPHGAEAAPKESTGEDGTPVAQQPAEGSEKESPSVRARHAMVVPPPLFPRSSTAPMSVVASASPLGQLSPQGSPPPAGAASGSATSFDGTARMPHFGNSNNNNSSFNNNNANNSIVIGNYSLNTSFLNPSFTSAWRDPLANSFVNHQNRTALIAELRRRRERLQKQLAALQREATSRNIFALVRASNASQLQYLLQEGLCNVNERDYNGCTPLHVAAGEGNQAIIRVLLSFDADVLLTDHCGRTALDCAAANRHSGAARYLLTAIQNKQQQKQKVAAAANSSVDERAMADTARRLDEDDDEVSREPFQFPPNVSTSGFQGGAEGSVSIRPLVSQPFSPSGGMDIKKDAFLSPSEELAKSMRRSRESVDSAVAMADAAAAANRAASHDRTLCPLAGSFSVQALRRLDETSSTPIQKPQQLKPPVEDPAASLSIHSATPPHLTSSPGRGRFSTGAATPPTPYAYVHEQGEYSQEVLANILEPIPPPVAAAHTSQSFSGELDSGLPQRSGSMTVGRSGSMYVPHGSLPHNPVHLSALDSIAAARSRGLIAAEQRSQSSTPSANPIQPPAGEAPTPLGSPKLAAGVAGAPRPVTSAPPYLGGNESLTEDDLVGDGGSSRRRDGGALHSGANSLGHVFGASAAGDAGATMLRPLRPTPMGMGKPAVSPPRSSSVTGQDFLTPAVAQEGGSHNSRSGHDMSAQTYEEQRQEARLLSAKRGSEDSGGRPTSGSTTPAAGMAPAPVLGEFRGTASSVEQGREHEEQPRRGSGGSATMAKSVSHTHSPPGLPPARPARVGRAAEEEEFLQAADDVYHLHYSSYTTVSDTVPLVVCMAGLPGRGKSFISKRLVRYMNWKGVPCRVFNAGNYRRKMLGVEGTAGANFFDPSNPQGAQLREKMAELACEDLVNFVSSHALAVGILDATNTTRKRRAWLRDYFHAEAEKRRLPYRLLFIESVCTDDTIITENILRSKCNNDDFKNVKDTKAVIEEFHDRIAQYEKVYETLDPMESLSYIKIINVKHHVILHRVPNGLGSRVAFFLMNLHPVAYPIYIALPGETVGDKKHVFGGEERLTPRGEQYALALKQFVQDRYVPHMVVLHATNYSVLSTLAPLFEGADVPFGGEEEYPAVFIQPGDRGMPTSASTQKLFHVAARSPADGAEKNIVRRTRRRHPSGSVGARSRHRTHSAGGAHSTTGNSSTHRRHRTNERGDHEEEPEEHSGRTASAMRRLPNTEAPPMPLHLEAGHKNRDQLRAMAGGDLSVVPVPEYDEGEGNEEEEEEEVGLRDSSNNNNNNNGAPSSEAKQQDDTEEEGVKHANRRSRHSSSSASSHSGGEDDSEEDDVADEVLCPVPGLDNINYGRFSGHTAAWVKERYPRLSSLLYDPEEGMGATGSESRAAHTMVQRNQEVEAAKEEDGEETRPPSSGAAGSPLLPRDAVAASRGAVHFDKLSDALQVLQHTASTSDPRLSYCVQFPNGESCRQVNVRLEPALMAVMRTQSPVFVVAPPVPAQGVLSFFMDVIPELSPTLRLPAGCVIELGVKDDVVVHPLLPDALPPSFVQSPLKVPPELEEAMKKVAAEVEGGGSASS